MASVLTASIIYSYTVAFPGFEHTGVRGGAYLCQLRVGRSRIS